MSRCKVIASLCSGGPCRSLTPSPAQGPKANPEVGEMFLRGPHSHAAPCLAPSVSPQATTLLLWEGAELTAAGVGVLQWMDVWPLVSKSSRKVVFHHGLAGLFLQPCKDLLPWQPQGQRVRPVLFHHTHHQGWPNTRLVWGCSPVLFRASEVTSQKAFK